MAILPEAVLKENALALTALFETSQSPPDCFGRTGGNFDGMGMSWGAIQFNFGQGTLQPLFTDLLVQHNAVVKKAFMDGGDVNGWDFDYFVELIQSGDDSRMLQFGENITNPNNKNQILEPWRSYFYNLGVSDEGTARQVQGAESYFNTAKVYFDRFDLWTRRGFALMFDISVQSGSISSGTQDLILQDFAEMDTTGMSDEAIETWEMQIISNRKADEVSETWMASYRERKLAIANGSGWVYGGTLFMDTAEYDMILEPAFGYTAPIETMDYVIQSGDTLWLISQEFNTDIQTIRNINRDQNLDIIYAGQTIQVPYVENWQPEEPEEVIPEPTPIEDIEGTYEYTEQDVRDMLHATKGTRHIRFRFDLLNVNDIKIRELKNVISGEVQMNAFNSIKRTAKFQIREDETEEINFFTDRIQPFVELKMPDKYVSDGRGGRALRSGGWIEYPLGVFLLSSPKKQEDGDHVYRDIEAYDGLVILQEDKFLDRYTIQAGTNYVQAVVDILQTAGISKYNLAESDHTLKNDLEYEPGIGKYEAIADLLNAVNFTPLWVDDYGYFTSSPYISPQEREPNYSYLSDEFSVILDDMEEELDLFSVPNSWVAVYSEVDGEENDLSLISSYVNDSSESPTSTLNRGRTIVDYRQVNEIADQQALDVYVQRIAYNASQIFGKVRFRTAIMPFHGFQDVVTLSNEKLGITGKYSETSWKISLEAGAMMEHEARKVIYL